MQPVLPAPSANSSLDFKLLFEASPMAIAVLQAVDGKFIEINRAFLKLLGYSRDEVVGRSSDELQLWGDLAERDKVLGLLNQQGYYHRFFHEYRCKSGQIGTALASIDTVKLGGDFYLLSFLTEGNQLSIKQRVLLALEPSPNLVLEHMQTGFAYCRMLFEKDKPQDFIYLQVDESFETRTGLVNVIGRKASELIPNLLETNPALFDIYGRVSQGGPPEHFEIYLDALQRWFSISVHSPKPQYFFALFDDITQRKHMEETLQEQKEFFYLIAENIADFIVVLDLEGHFIYTSPSYMKFIGSENNLIGLDSFANIHPDDQVRVKSVFNETVLTGVGRQAHYRVVLVDGSIHEMESRGSVIRGKACQVTRVLVVSRDVTERICLENELALQRKRSQRYLDNTSTLMLELDSDGRVTMVNHALENLMGYAEHELLGRNWFATCVSPPQGDGVVYPAFHQDLSGDLKPFGEFENHILCQDGRKRLIAWHNSYQVDATGQIKRTFSSGEDITERKQEEVQVRQLAFYDTLTQLPNRRLLSERLSLAMTASKRSNVYGAMMFLDLDNFKPINDTHGHDVGDLLLIEVAERLKRCVREKDTVARFGGDEFVVMFSELDADKSKSTEQVRVLAEKIRTELSKTYVLKHQLAGVEKTVKHDCSASIGVSLFINQDVSPKELYKGADSAMYKAKMAGGNAIRIADSPPCAMPSPCAIKEH
jgi:diguanylate cyclase (GGDEF)-like protein/PAS domain S-box-containing protein